MSFSLRSLINKVKSHSAPVFHVNPEHHIEPAFTFKGVEYFHFTDAFNIPCERALDGLSAYNELNIRIDRPFLEAHLSANEAEYKKQSINLGHVMQRDMILRERLNFVVPPRRFILKLASIVYFDKSENPYRYDDKYGQKKIELWEGSEDLMDFFLSLPIKNLIFSKDSSREDLQTFLSVVELMDQKHLTNLITSLSSAKAKSGSSKALQSIQKQEDHIKSYLSGSIS